MANNEDFILWLPSWYPNKFDAYNGDFIQRHARAASLLNNIVVINVTSSNIKKSPEVEVSHSSNLTEEIIYLKQSNTFLSKIVKQFTWFRLYKRAIKKYIAKYGKPSCIHVHVAWKAGILALWAKKKYNIPYVITEHWGIYNHVIKDNYSSRPGYFKFITKMIYRKADYFLSVSKFIAESISSLIARKPYSVLPNVVPTSLFFLGTKNVSVFTFLHVSNMVELKNVPGILKAFKLLIEGGLTRKVKLVLIGNKDDEYAQLAMNMQIPADRISFKGEIPYEKVAHEMKGADCLILNSIIENSPCVIGEALCCGVPVIATKVGGIPELINEQNGILIPPNDEGCLSTAMNTIIVDSNKYNRDEIALHAQEKFGYLNFSNKVNEIYSSISDKKAIFDS